MRPLYVLRREARAFLVSPYTYAIGAAYLVISGIFFVNILVSSEIPDLAQYYSNIASTLLVLVPIVAMRSFAEERRTGALDITLSWPGSRTGLVLGKFVANTVYLWLLSSVVWLYYHLIGDVAHISPARTAGGFIGLLLMASAFSALALMVSARASSPVSAAFLGFGLLLFLWILNFAPGWIGRWLDGIGPAKHFDAFPRGAIYWEDVAYFLLCTLVGLGFAVSALERDRPGRPLGTLLRRGALLGAVAAVCTASVALAGNVEGVVDLTSKKQNSITQTTHDVIKRLHGQRIRMTGFAEPLSNDAHRLESLAKQFQAGGANLDYRLVDPDAQPATARQAGVSGYGEALVEIGDRKENLRDFDQGTLTSLLLRLSRPTKPVACFIAGHGERDIGDDTEVGLSHLASVVRYLFEVKELALAAPGAATELEQCAVVIEAGPRIPLLPQELSMLAAHARNNGRLLIFADAWESYLPPPGQASARDQLNTLLTPWGLSISPGIIRDASALADDPSSIVSLDFPASASPVVRQVQLQELPVVFTNAVPVGHTAALEEANRFSALVRSSKKSWIPGAPGQPVHKGPFDLAVLSDTSRLTGPADKPEIARTRIGVVGSAEMATNRVVDILGNRQFASALVQWVAQEDDLISAGRPATGFDKVVLTTTQKDRLIRQGIVFPTLALLLPLPFAVLRLKRG
jgi:ABC-2 type transport system permease protein